MSDGTDKIKKRQRSTIAPRWEKIVEALKVCRGNLSAAADQLDCSRQYIYDMCERHEEVKEALRSTREGRKDFYEGQLDKLAGEGNVAAVIFGLKTIARDRGYGEQVEVKGGGELHVHVGIAGVDDE